MAKRRKVPIEHAGIVQLFAQRLREVRLGRGMTQAELARLAGVTETYVSRLEGAGAAPGIDLVARLAQALGTTTRELLPTEEPLDDLTVLREQAVQMLRTLVELGDRDAFLRLNPILALVLEAAAKRR